MQRYPSDASGDYRYLICIFIAESMENKVWRIWCIREDYSPYGSPFGPLLTQRYPSWCLR
ncbi:hypothetical protein MCV52_002222 [Salmonella enterica]|uniref:Uncharacterized protein n=2 Tax=Salmonella enterica TaxID=28901 RepID=A0A8E9IAZ8_SALER|nr:hypothetical protein [Salmonella enterica]EEC6505342.1 hypothetical protein [Salmonella enterica subsp. enterica serovar 4,[5],12:i:-]EEE7872303.1 hypothetical protein [Salmonella enterica subsp. enterica serovar Enteritidis]EDO1483431.1 hypothetical protein [Salmonella enterica subsp. enterica serovar Mississippi]EDZ3151070.1 hypothetical protein [Salmonella enterica]EDZ3806552.1 hypothetical protein [Salmonella enterica]